MDENTNSEELVFTMVIHYFEDDHNCDGDFACVDLLKDGKTVRTYGGFYHEQVIDMVKGFAEGVTYATSRSVRVDVKEIADYSRN